MDLRLTFNEDAKSYDRLRPTYTEKLFDDVIEFSNLNENKLALEIGIGTGQATQPFLESKCRITAIELGDQMAKFSRNKFSDYKNLEVINQDFEKVKLSENTYDLIYSASAFHWIPLDFGLEKVSDLLKPGGVFAWFSIQPSPAPEHLHIHDAVQKIYAKHEDYFSKNVSYDVQSIKKLVVEKQQYRTDALNKYGFVNITEKLYYSKRTFNSKDYVTLLSTFSDHKAMPEEIRTPFLNEIAETIDEHGGVFTMADTILLCMGRKKSNDMT